MANLPGLRINMYYRYIHLYNACLDYKAGIKGSISDVNEFNNSFNDFKKAYSDLETILYVNIIYSIAEINHKFLSFPTVKLPMRISRPLYWYLLASNSLKNYVHIGSVKFSNPKGDNIEFEVPEFSKTISRENEPSKPKLCRPLVIKITRSMFDTEVEEFYKNEDEDISKVLDVVKEHPKFKTVWDEAKDIYELLKSISKEDIYEDGIAYKFMKYLSSCFGETYGELEKKKKSCKKAAST